jgi:predicted nuclease with TOPRIM domain
MTIEHDENLEAAYYSVCKQRDSDAREAERLLADVHRLINDRAEECRAKEEALREAERLREMLANSDTDNDETNAENRQLRAEVERLRAELTKEMNEVGRLTAELEDYKQAASAEAQIADEFKAERDALKAALEEHIYFVGGPYYCAKHGHGPCSARQALKGLEEK